jgi:DNA-binding CsgD family transcriptional regulator
MSDLPVTNEVRLDVLRWTASPAVLIDRNGAVVARNAAAEAIMGTDLRVCRGTLLAADATNNRELRNLVLQLHTAAAARGKQPPARAFIRRDGRAPLVIEALPVARLASEALASARAVLVITDLDAQQSPSEEALRRAFGLTAAEARLASRLAGGGSLDEATHRLGIAKGTARSQLKAIFAKTGTSRQAQLVALLARLAISTITAGPACELRDG